VRFMQVVSADDTGLREQNDELLRLHVSDPALSRRALLDLLLDAGVGFGPQPRVSRGHTASERGDTDQIHSQAQNAHRSTAVSERPRMISSFRITIGDDCAAL
jgi:hypothetical protein